MAPSEYLKRNVWVSTQPMEEPEVPRHLIDTLEWIGWDRIMFASDYPHWDFDDPAGRDSLVPRRGATAHDLLGERARALRLEAGRSSPDKRQGPGVTIAAGQSAFVPRSGGRNNARSLSTWLAGRNVGRHVGVLALIAVLGFLTVYPVAMLLYGSLHSTPPGAAGEFNLAGYRAILTAENLKILLNTVAISLAKTIPSLLTAIFLAWIVARTDTPARRTLEILITLPFFIPPILTAMAWGMLGNPQVGALNLAWKWLTGSETHIINVYSWGGVVWHMMQYSTPFLFLFIVEAFRAMDPALEESSRMCGASRWRTFRSITLMLMLPVISSSFLLSFIRGIESFESPLFFGTPAGIYRVHDRALQFHQSPRDTRLSIRHGAQLRRAGRSCSCSSSGSGACCTAARSTR